MTRVRRVVVHAVGVSRYGGDNAGVSLPFQTRDSTANYSTPPVAETERRRWRTNRRDRECEKGRESLRRRLLVHAQISRRGGVETLRPKKTGKYAQREFGRANGRERGFKAGRAHWMRRDQSEWMRWAPPRQRHAIAQSHIRARRPDANGCCMSLAAAPGIQARMRRRFGQPSVGPAKHHEGNQGAPNTHSDVGPKGPLPTVTVNLEVHGVSGPSDGKPKSARKTQCNLKRRSCKPPVHRACRGEAKAAKRNEGAVRYQTRHCATCQGGKQYTAAD